MPHPTTKTERLLEIEVLLLAHPEGLTRAELARRVGVHRSTITRYLPELTTQFQVFEHDDGRLAIDRDRYLARMRVTLHEAMAIYVGARLLYRHSDLANPHVAGALLKLGAALEGVAPALADDIVHTAEHMTDKPGRESDRYVAVMEALTRALADGRWLRIRYRSLSATEDSVSRFAPYILEPFGAGFGTYAIGLREPPGAVHTLKVERIQSAELTDAPYTAPVDADHANLLGDAWAIWRTNDAEPVEVALRFSRRVAARVRETRWHPSETTEATEDGGLVWRASVDAPQEMRPWIRSWGPDVEVIGPESLRALIADDMRQAAKLYGVAE